jgi:hypothetical protein
MAVEPDGDDKNTEMKQVAGECVKRLSIHKSMVWQENPPKDGRYVSLVDISGSLVLESRKNE